MRKFTLIILSSLIAFCGYSQQKVVITAPASIAGSYIYGTAANFGAELADSIWCGDLILMDDGMGAEITDGCEQTTNDYTGMVVMIDRGSCTFVSKAQFAQAAGAIAVIIVNNIATGAIGLGGNVTDVTIPVVSFSLADGDIIKPILAAGPVSVCMGSKIYDNDLTINDSNTLFPYQATLNTTQLGSDSSYVYIPVVNVINSGKNDATDVNTNFIISFEGNEIYNETLNVAEIKEDSTSFLVFPDFLFTDATPGEYTIDVSNVAASGDDDVTDNDIARGNIQVVNGSAIAKCSWNNTTNLPNLNTTITYGVLTPGTDDRSVEFYQGINFPEAGPNTGVTIDSFTTTVGNIIAGATTLDGINPLFTLYEWNDLDGNFLFTNINLDYEFTTAGVSLVEFGPTSTAEETITRPFSNAAPPNDELNERILTDPNKTYVIGCKYIGIEGIGFGFDTDYSNGYALDISGPTHADVPYIFTTTFPNDVGDLEALFRFGNVRGSLSVGYYISDYLSKVEEIVDLVGTVNVYPNPASNDLWAEIDLEETASELTLSVFDANGKLLSARTINNVQSEKLHYDTTVLSSGNYFMKITSANAVKNVPFVIIK